MGESVRFPPVTCCPAALKKTRPPTELGSGSQGGFPAADAVPARPTVNMPDTSASTPTATVPFVRNFFIVSVLSLGIEVRVCDGTASPPGPRDPTGLDSAQAGVVL